MDLPKIREYLVSLGQPDYRLRQISKNYYSARYSRFSDMTDLSAALRSQLDASFTLSSVKLVSLVKGRGPEGERDWSPVQKALLTLSDGLQVETVLMDYGDWLTACISTQVGCPLACTFCATGKMGLKRNLTASEIIDQVLFWKNQLINQNITNFSPLVKGGIKVGLRIVFMGMGEPFLNWDNLVQSLDILRHELKIGARKISISTAGIAPRIIDFANLDTEINLAISLHSADQATRAKMMPIARQYPLNELVKSLNYYTKTTRRQVFFEYLLAQDVNDTPYYLDLLIDFIKSNNLFYLNLIPLNPIKDGLTPSSKLKYFQQELTKHHVNFSTRRSLGQSINSACGQLIVNNQ